MQMHKDCNQIGADKGLEGMAADISIFPYLICEILTRLICESIVPRKFGIIRIA